MTTNRMHRRRARRARAVRHCLVRCHQQARIEEELRALLARSDSLREVYLPSNPFILSAAGYAGPVVGPVRR